MNENKAEIIGFLCAEGCYVNTFRIFHELDKRRGSIYLRFKHRRVIEFSNYNIKILKRFAHLIYREYRFQPKLIKNNERYAKVILCRLNVIEDLLKYSDYGSLKWSIPKEMFFKEASIKYAFLSGFIDGDGSVDDRRIRIYSANFNGLLQISEILKSLNIYHTLQGPIKINKKHDMFAIYINKKVSRKMLKNLRLNKI